MGACQERDFADILQLVLLALATIGSCHQAWTARTQDIVCNWPSIVVDLFLNLTSNLNTETAIL